MAADVTQITTVYESPKWLYINCTNESVDGTGETAAIKVDKSAKTGPNGAEPSKLAIYEVVGSVKGFNAVKVLFDHTADDEAVYLVPGANGYSFAEIGGLVDPGSAGGTGDIVITTDGGDADSSYNIFMKIKKKD